MYELHQGDCLDVMLTLPPKSIDAIICDPPYGTTNCAWDSVIPFASMWECIKRVIKPRGAVVLFGSQPFTSALVMSNPKWFRYEVICKKGRVTGHLDANRRPLREHENILVFCDGQGTYNPQMTRGERHTRGPFGRHRSGKRTQIYNDFLDNETRQYESDDYFPRSTIEFLWPMQSTHSTQKPVDLMAYLIKTYTNPGDTVLDFTMGSGSTGVACAETGRTFIGIEMDPHYFAIAEERIETAYRKAQGLPRLGKQSDTDNLPLFVQQQTV